MASTQGQSSMKVCSKIGSSLIDASPTVADKEKDYEGDNDKIERKQQRVNELEDLTPKRLFEDEEVQNEQTSICDTNAKYDKALETVPQDTKQIEVAQYQQIDNRSVMSLASDTSQRGPSQTVPNETSTFGFVPVNKR